MKTPMQELIEKFESSIIKTDFLIWFSNKKNRENILEKEKQKIINIYKDGWIIEEDMVYEMDDPRSTKILTMNAERYYNEIFNNNERI